MEGPKQDKLKRRRIEQSLDNDTDIIRGSGVNYSVVKDRHVDDDRYEKHRAAVETSLQPLSQQVGSGGTTSASKISAQMAAVMRLMAGKEERTIAEKLSDSNRPTWEQYKKDNEDKLDIAGVDRRKMEAYRKELDDQREKLLTRGTNHRKDDDSHEKKKRRKKKKKRHDGNLCDKSDTSHEYDSTDSRSHKRKKHRHRNDRKYHDRKKSSRHNSSDDSDSRDDRKKSAKHHKRKSDRKRGRSANDSSSGDSYRLSKFFTKSSENDV